MHLATNIIYKEQGDGTDSWFIYYDEKIPEMVTKDPNSLEVFNEKLKYHQRKPDGIDAYLSIAAEFRLSPLSRDVRKSLETQLEAVRNELVNGQWITSLEKLEECTVIGNLTQEIYDRLHLSLTTYISANY